MHRPPGNRQEMIMKLTPIAVSLVATLAAMPALPAEFSYDFVACTHSTSKVLDGGPELTALGVESWGIVASSTTKEWENATTRCVGYLRIAAGKPVGRGVCRWLHATGDTAIGEWDMPASGENRFTWLAGTGKLKGIQGGGSFQTVSNARPVEPGTGQSCRRDWGKFTLPAAG
jgi:hypothetical protein